MAFDTENAVFGSEFDPSGIVKFATAAVDNLKKVGVAQETVNTTMTETTGVIDQNTTAIKKNTQAGDASVKAMQKVADTQKQVVDQFKKPIVPQVDLTQINQIGTKLAQLKKNFDSKAGNLKVLLDTSELDALDEKIIAAKGEFEQINAIVDSLSKKLLSLEPGTKEFNDVAAAVRAGNQVLKEYTTLYTEATKAVADSDPKYKSIRQRLKEYRDELTRLEDAGQDETQQYKKTQIAAARLTDQYGDMQQQVRILASDTKNLDFALGVVNAVGAGFQAVSGGLQLFGLSSEDAEKAQTKLLAIMSLVQGAQQLQNLLLKESVIRTVGADLAAKGYALTQRLLTVTLGATAAASKTLQAALITTGIGALVVALGYLISKMVEWSGETDTAKRAQENLNKLLEIQQGLYEEDGKRIDDNAKLRNTRLKQQNADQSKIFQAGQNDLRDKFKLAQDRIKVIQTEYDNFRKQGATESNKAFAKRLEDGKEYTDNLLKEETSRNKEIGDIIQQGFEDRENETLRRIEKARTDRILFAKQNNETAKEGKNARQIELDDLKFNYQQQREAQIHDHTAVKALDLQYQSQRRSLREKYRKEDYEENKNIAQEMEKLQIDAATRRIELIGDEFKRREADIKNNARKERDDAQDAFTAFQNKLNDDLREGILTPEAYASQMKQLTDVYDKLFDQIAKKVVIETGKLNADIFQNLIKELDRQLAFAVTNISTVATAEIGKLSAAYVQGTITYETYQKELTKITNRETKLRLEATKKTLEGEIGKLNIRIYDSKITPEEKKALEDQRNQLLSQLSQTQRELDTADADNKKKKIDSDQAALDARLQAYSQFTKAIVGLINQIDAAEQQRLDRAISYQQKRVDYAQQIAEAGNAEYLEMEQKRLDELERKREESAQKTLAINNALVLSEALVAVISAIAKAAAEGSFVNILAAAGAVIGAVGAGYAFVSSLDNPVPQFWEGTPFVEGAVGRDQVPAMVSRGERITDVETNQQYWDTLNAIHNKDIPADVLNSFVNKYPNVDIPMMNVDRLSNSMDFAIATGISETNQKLGELTDIMENWQPVLVEPKLDQNGFSVAWSKQQRRERLRKRA